MTTGFRRRRRAGMGFALASWATALFAVALAPAAFAEDQPAAARKATHYLATIGPHADEAIQIAKRTRAFRERMAEKRGLEIRTNEYEPDHYQVFLVDGHNTALAIVDTHTRSVLKVWTGFKAEFRGARGYPGYYGGQTSALWVWLPLCILFVVPFVDLRRPFRLFHLDLLVMLAFSIPFAFFSRGDIDVAVPLVYPIMLYVMVRMIVAGFRPRRPRGKLVPHLPPKILAVGIVLLVAGRIALDVSDTKTYHYLGAGTQRSHVTDAGIAGERGADRILHGDILYTNDPTFHWDTYGPVNYVAYVPFDLAFPFDPGEPAHKAAHAASITFDLLTIVGLFLLGRRWRRGQEGRVLGLALGFAWAAYPFTTYVLGNNTNDSIVAMFTVFSLVAFSSEPLRGLMLGLGAAAKFIPLALAPLFAAGTERINLRSALHFGIPFILAFALPIFAFIPGAGIGRVYEATIGYQSSQHSAFSLWAMHPSLQWLQTLVRVAAVALGIAVAFVPKSRSLTQVAALGAAVVICVSLTLNNWTYVYVTWFTPLVLAALFSSFLRSSSQDKRLVHQSCNGREPLGAEGFEAAVSLRSAS